MAVVWRLLGGWKNKPDNTVAGNAHSYVRARRRSSETPDGSLISPTSLRRIHTKNSFQQAAELSTTKRSCTKAASLFGNASASDIAQHSPEVASDGSDTNSVKTVLEGQAGQPTTAQCGPSSVSSGSSIDTAITMNSCPESAGPVSQPTSEAPSSVKESIVGRGSCVALLEEVEDIDHFLAMVWEARRSAGRLPYWKLLDVERDEEAKRAIIVKGELEIQESMAKWLKHLSEATQRLSVVDVPKRYTPSYVTLYQLERLEMTTREELAADEMQQYNALRSECQSIVQVILAARHRAERDRQDACHHFEIMEEMARRILLKAEGEISQQLFDHDQSVMLILNELKRVNHAHHVAKYYSA
eukprot:GGOE01000483.1.p1 GENE.GGOE01000483.1~~GGOE01000483.1.p1  ORF type:complete len:358 (-),score=66.75 GGOE01000483.1:389-1462(-)